MIQKKVCINSYLSMISIALRKMPYSHFLCASQSADEMARISKRKAVPVLVRLLQYPCLHDAPILRFGAERKGSTITPLPPQPMYRDNYHSAFGIASTLSQSETIPSFAIGIPIAARDTAYFGYRFSFSSAPLLAPIALLFDDFKSPTASSLCRFMAPCNFSSLAPLS